MGSWVVLPEPVSPATMTTWWSRIGGGDVVAALADRQLRGVANGRAGERGRAGRGALRGPGVRSPGLSVTAFVEISFTSGKG